MFRWQAHKGLIRSLAFDPKGHLLATATGKSNFLHLWDVQTGALVRKLDVGSPVQVVAFAPASPLVAAGSLAAVRIWDTLRWEPFSNLDASYVYEIAFAQGDWPSLAAASAGNVSVWSGISLPSPQGRHVPYLRLSHGSHIVCLDFTPDGRLVTNSLDKHVAIWELITGTPLRTWDRPSTPNHGPIRVSPDGTRVAYAHGKVVTVREIDPPFQESGPTSFVGHTGPVWALGWSADGRGLMTTSSDGTARLWDSTSGSLIRSLDWGIGKIYAADFSPDGLTCAAGGQSGEVVVWDVDG